MSAVVATTAQDPPPGTYRLRFPQRFEEAVALLGLFSSPISGASMNPARTWGPDIVADNHTGWWVYVSGPPLGALLAVGLIGLARGIPHKQEGETAEGGALPL